MSSESKQAGERASRAPDEIWCNFMTGLLVLSLIALLLYAITSQRSPLPGGADRQSTLVAASDEEAALSALHHGKMIYNTCAPCHGEQAEGMDEQFAPNLTQLPSWYLRNQLVKFRDGYRGTHPDDKHGLRMYPMGKSLHSERDIEGVIAYIESLPKAMPKNTFVAATTENIEAGKVTADPVKGQTAYATCVACHGQKADGMEALNAPALYGLNDWYIASQLHKFKEGYRGTDPNDLTGAQMRPMAMTIPNEQTMRDIAAYITTTLRKEQQ